MQRQTEFEPYRDVLIDLMLSIKNEIQIGDKDIVLTILQLNSVEKIMEFSDWVKTKMKDGKLQATPEEVMHMTAQIGGL
ncbi:MAG: hypothetical protein J6A69_02085 [Clostridia bacterium]|nr:hypothetical protein [Clostridia bacterium]